MKRSSILWLNTVVAAFCLTLSSGTFQSSVASATPVPAHTVKALTDGDSTFTTGPSRLFLSLDGTSQPSDSLVKAGNRQVAQSTSEMGDGGFLPEIAIAVNTGDAAKDAKPAAAPNAGGGIGDFLVAVPAVVWLIVFVVIFFVLIRWMGKRNAPTTLNSGSSNNRPGGSLDGRFTRSAARKFEPTDTGNKSFKDVAGCDEAIKKLKRVLRWLKAPGWFSFFGARLPKGVLLVGPPGTGKTLLAKALAGEAGASFYAISGSQFVEVYVGVGAARVRDLFQEARNEVARTSKPVIIFIDEIDAVGRQRGGNGPGASHDEREQTLNQILVEMDGFAPNQGILVLAATNRADILDAALKRPGRFDYQVLVDLPDVAGRAAIYAIHTQGKPMAQGVDMQLLAARTPGFSGADIEAACNEAATIAAERTEELVTRLRNEGKSEQEINAIPKGITLAEFDEAIDVVQMGEARTSRAHAMSSKDMEQTAYHEVGHAAVMQARGGDPVTKITIVPRARALGYTQALPEGDRFNTTQEQMLTRIMMAMGGRAAQVFFLKTTDTGASNDFQQAASLARRMVTEFGMSTVGPVSITSDNPYAPPTTGPALLDKVDSEWSRIVNECYAEALKIIETNAERIERIVKVLLEKETLLGPEFRTLWNDEPAPTASAVVEGAAEGPDSGSRPAAG